MKWLTIFGGMLMALGMLLGSSAMAGSECALEAELTSPVGTVEAASASPGTETVVVISESSNSASSEVVVKGGPSQSVRVIAPSNVTVTAIGGNGTAGAAGTPGN